MGRGKPPSVGHEQPDHRIRGPHEDTDFAPLDASHPPDPGDIYGVSKVCSETLVHCYRRRYGVEFVALRYPSICGPGRLARHGVLALCRKLIEDAIAGRAFTIARGGDQRNDVVYIGDVAHSIVLALDAGELTQWVFSIGTCQGVTAVLRRHFPGSRLDIGPGLDFRGGYKQSDCRFDITGGEGATGIRTAVRPRPGRRRLHRGRPDSGSGLVTWQSGRLAPQSWRGVRTGPDVTDTVPRIRWFCPRGCAIVLARGWSDENRRPGT